MGSEYSVAIIKDVELEMTNKEIEAAAESIFEQAAFDHGHSGYSGSFAEKDSVSIDRSKVYDTENEADKRCEDNDKWGPADVVPLKGVGWYMAGSCSS